MFAGLRKAGNTLAFEILPIVRRVDCLLLVDMVGASEAGAFEGSFRFRDRSWKELWFGHEGRTIEQVSKKRF